MKTPTNHVFIHWDYLVVAEDNEMVLKLLGLKGEKKK